MRAVRFTISGPMTQEVAEELCDEIEKGFAHSLHQQGKDEQALVEEHFEVTTEIIGD